MGAQGGRIEGILISIFSEGPNVRGGGILIKEGPTLGIFLLYFYYISTILLGFPV